MPRRASTRNATRQETPPVELPPQDVPILEPVSILRRQWKWAAFSQFFFTFNHLFNMPDVSLIQIEQDLINGTHVVIPRIMQRLLFTISYDRKINLDNWQTALRKQYRKRDPAANPIGPEPRVEDPDEPATSPPPNDSLPIPELKVEDFDKKKEGEQDGPTQDATATDGEVDKPFPESTRASTLEPAASVNGATFQPSEIDSELPSTRYASLGADANDQEGEQEESKDWLELPMLEKLDTLHILTEWQFQSPLRLRQLMRSDNEDASWRVEPIGYDAKHNAYWLIGTDRLWIQRPLPKPPKPKKTKKSLKRKRAPAKSAKGKGKGKARASEVASAPAAKRQRLTKDTKKKIKKEEEEVPAGRGRAAKAQAKTKMEQQVAQLAATKKELELEAKRASTRSSPRKASSAAGSTSISAPPPRGTRASRRLRGKADEDEDEEWQAVPDEWLDEEKKKKEKEKDVKEVNGRRITRRSAAMELKTGLESEGSEISDLTELTEEVNGQEEEEDEEDEEEEEQEEEEEPEEEEPALPTDFVEWETIAVTLYEWEHVADPFEKATHYLEKALYKVLVNDLIPPITEELREIERKERLEAALNQRKRSSRLLIRQSMKEEAEAEARKKAEEEEKNSRAKRLAVREQKQEDARAERESAREQRRLAREEREEKERIEKELAEQKEKERQERLAKGIKEDGEAKPKPARKRKKPAPAQNGRHDSSGSRTPGEEWEVDCEICHRRGRNIDDGIPMASCGNCGKWQHIPCHDAADQQAGRRKRNWNSVEFLCRHCQLAKAGVYQAGYGQMQMHHQPHGAHNQHQNPYAHLVGTSAYPAQSYMGNSGHPSLQSYASTASVNGRGNVPYGQDYPMTSATHPSLASHAQQHSAGYQQPYGGGVSFTHYQPHLREFTANPQAYSSSHVRAYGHTQPYSQYQGASTHQYQAPQAQWGTNSTPYHQVSSQRHSPADPAAATAAPSPGHSQVPAQMPGYAQYYQPRLAPNTFSAQHVSPPPQPQPQPQEYPASSVQQPPS